MLSLLLLLALVVSPRIAPSDLAIQNVSVLDVPAGAFLPEQTVLLRDDRIVWIGPSGEADVPAGAEVIEASGKFLIPGLWDMHVHVDQSWDAQVSLPLFLAYGVTGVRDMGSDCREPSESSPCLPGMLEWRERIERGELVGPRLVALSSWVVTGDDQVGDDVDALVSSFIERGADFVKVMQGLSASVYERLLGAASERGLPVVGHIPLSVGMVGAARAGQASIEHARDVLFDGFDGGEEWRRTTTTQNPPTAILRQMVDGHDSERLREIGGVLVEHGTRYVPTHLTRRFDAMADDEQYRDDARRKYVPAQRWDAWSYDAESVVLRDPSPAGRRVFLDFYVTGLRATRILHEAGVEILAGTDANDSYIFPGSSLHEELGQLVEAGLTPAEALRSATLASARFLGLESEFATIAPGYKADLLILAEDPLEDIANTQAIEAVIFDGRVHDRGALDAMLAGVAEYAAGMEVGVDLPAEQLQRFVGGYDAPFGRIEISLVDEALFLRLPGRGRVRLRATSETEFVVLAQGATLSFESGSDGAVSGLTFDQGGRGGRAAKVD